MKSGTNQFVVYCVGRSLALGSTPSTAQCFHCVDFCMFDISTNSILVQTQTLMGRLGWVLSHLDSSINNESHLLRWLDSSVWSVSAGQGLFVTLL